MTWFIDAQTKMLAPFCPHICEEIWEKIGGQGFIAKAAYPAWDEAVPMDESIEKSEDFIRSVIEDIQEIVEVAQLKDAKNVNIFTADDWKYKVLSLSTGKNMGQAMKDVMADQEMRKVGKEVSKYVGKVISDRLVPSGVDEKAVLDEATGLHRPGSRHARRAEPGGRPGEQATLCHTGQARAADQVS